MADEFKIARKSDLVVIPFCVAPIFIVGRNEEDVIVFKAFCGVDSLELDGVVGFVVRRLV